MSKTNDELPSVHSESEKMEEPVVVEILRDSSPLKEVIESICLETEEPIVNGCISDEDTARVLHSIDDFIDNGEPAPQLAVPSLGDSDKDKDNVFEDFEKFLTGDDACDNAGNDACNDAGDVAGDAAGDAVASGSVSENSGARLDLPQKVESPYIKSLEDGDERDMMGELGLVRKEEKDRIEEERKMRAQAAKLLNGKMDTEDN